jgi:excisionase family DNA binding protein
MTERGAYSPEEAAQWLGVSLATVYRLMERGELPFVKIGSIRGRRFIARSTLEVMVTPRDQSAEPA